MVRIIFALALVVSSTSAFISHNNGPCLVRPVRQRQQQQRQRACK